MGYKKQACALCKEVVSIDTENKNCNFICGQCVAWMLDELTHKGFKIKAPPEYFAGEVDPEYPGHGLEPDFPNLIFTGF